MRSLYQSLLGDAFVSMPRAVQDLHSHTQSVSYTGRGSVERGAGWLARGLGALMAFPPAMADTPVNVRFDIQDGVETWTRDFGGNKFKSRLSARGGELLESFGWITIRFRLAADERGLSMQPLRWAVFGLSLPTLLWPEIVAHEFEEHGRFCFHVEATLPLAGRVVRYTGYLQPLAPDTGAKFASPPPCKP